MQRHDVLACVCVLAALSGVAGAADDPIDPIGRRDALASGLSGRPTPDSIARLTLLADQGDADAAQVLGFALAKGTGVGQDLPSAFRWYLRAVLAGRAESMLDAIKVWRAMPGTRQKEAERTIRERFTAEEALRLKHAWADAAAGLAAAEEEARLRAARAGDG